jgi:hypothetical protein
MRETLNAMQQITSQIQDQNTTIADVVWQGQNDSGTLKTLSVIATAYILASLIAARE